MVVVQLYQSFVCGIIPLGLLNGRICMLYNQLSKIKMCLQGFFFFLLSQEIKMVICEFYVHMFAFNFLSLSERFVFIHRILN